MMDGARTISRRDRHAVQRLADRLLDLDVSSLEAELADADVGATAAVLGLSVEELTSLVVPLMELSTELARSPEAGHSSGVTVSHAPRGGESAPRTRRVRQDSPSAPEAQSAASIVGPTSRDGGGRSEVADKVAGSQDEAQGATRRP